MTTARRAARAAILVALLAAASLAVGARERPETSCTACHGSEEWFPEEGPALIALHAGDVHAQVGVSCHDCHGGNPDIALAEDLEAAMDPDYGPNPFAEVPSPAEIPRFCGACHSDAAYMRTFRPSGRVDQEAEYWTSQHGMALREGDENVATCVDCHKAHGVLAAGNPESSVYPTHVADMCGACHGDAERMSGYELPDGRPIPVDQLARWRQSVHAHALLERGDLSAPTCNDCHGNHGAMPPGIESVTYVCGQCHGREATLFRASGKHEGFVAHNEMFLDGSVDCTACHADPEPPGSLEGLTRLSECATCHGNHSVMRPTIAMLAPLPATPCAFCHETKSLEGIRLEEETRTSERYVAMRDALLYELESEGVEGDDLFDALIDRSLELAPHVEAGSAGGGEGAQRRPEFERLYEKFRLGRIHYAFVDPITGEDVVEKVVRCSNCHAVADDPAPGTAAGQARTYVRLMSELTSLTATADRQLLAARRGGVEVRDGLLHLDNAVAAQIDLEVLVHIFSVDPESDFDARQLEGLEHARKALEEADKAHAELGFRRQGLAVSLVVIVLVLFGLALKIRQYSRAEQLAARKE